MRTRFGSSPLWVLAASLMLAAASAVAADPGDADVLFLPRGVGIAGTQNAMPVPEQINHDAVTGDTQALAVDLGNNVAQARVIVSNLVANERGRGGEQGLWQAFDAAGRKLVGGEGLFNGGDAGFVDGVGELLIAPGAPFRYLVFTALPYPDPFVPPEELIDSSDYLVRSITAAYEDESAPEQTFGNPLPDAAASADDWAGAALYGFDHGTAFVDASGRFLGAPIVVSDTECTGEGDNNLGCTIQFTDALKSTIAGEDVEGTIAVPGVSTVVDIRDDCGFPPGSDKPVQTLCATCQPVTEVDGGLDLGFTLAAGVTGPIVPPHLCGIPNAEGEPGRFVVVDVDADIEISRSVIEHVVDNSTHPTYECTSGAAILLLPLAERDERRSRLPVFGWLPKTAEPTSVANPEIPVLDANRWLVPELQDVTTGCGSTRAGSRRLSFLVYDLHHRLEAPYRRIIRDEISQLQVTVNETPACIDSAQAENLKSRVRLILQAYDADRLAYVRDRLTGLLSLVESRRLDREFAQCAFDFDTWLVTRVDPLDSSLVDRNFRGDLIVQIEHILYMMDRMLGVGSR